MIAVHPGEILREEFLIPMGLSAYAAAKACHVPRTRIERLANEQTAITADTALRLGRLFGTGPQFWMNLQSLHDLALAEQAGADIDQITPLSPAA